MEKTCNLIQEENKIVCITCNIKLDISYIDKRCPRCNTILKLPNCYKCKGCDK